MLSLRATIGAKQSPNVNQITLGDCFGKKRLAMTIMKNTVLIHTIYRTKPFSLSLEYKKLFKKMKHNYLNFSIKKNRNNYIKTIE